MPEQLVYDQVNELEALEHEQCSHFREFAMFGPIVIN